MDFFKKIGKEVSVFGLVFVVFIALFAYRQVTHVELSTISQDKLEEKIKDKDSFVVVVGSDKDNTTLNYKNVCLKYLEKNRKATTNELSEMLGVSATTIRTFKTDDGTIPSTFVMKNGKVKVQKSGSLSYYRIAELFK